MSIYVGTSGWSYNHWERVLYPSGLPPRRRLDVYAQHFQTVEVNSTYYCWPADATFAAWRRQLPDGFLLSVKAPRFLTRHRRLYGPERWVERIDWGLQRLQEKLGVLLVQLKVAVEFRHPTWHREEVFALLEHHDAAYCVMSGAHLPCILRATAIRAKLRRKKLNMM